MSRLEKTYTMATGPAGLPWDAYVARVTDLWHALLDREPDEVEVQRFLERYPGLLPGYRSMTITSGHSCLPPAVITQPPLSGLTKKVPDFMWIAMASDSIYPVLIEIERPGRRWFKNDGDPTSDLTHARQQLVTWRAWFRNPVNQQWFREYYELNGLPWSSRAIKPTYVLIYGRRAEFEGKPELNRARAEMPGDDEHYMTYDGLGLDPWSRDYVTCTKPTRDGFDVVAIPPTLSWGPLHMHQFARMRGMEAAIARCELLPEDRRAFLLERFEYWLDWVRNRGGIAGGERE